MKRTYRISDYTGLLLSFFCISALYFFPVIAKRSTVNAIMICGKNIIPSLFPYMVATRLTVHFFTDCIVKKSTRNKKVLLYILLLCGFVSGFPGGAVISGNMFSKGVISRRDAQKAAVYSSVASPAFCINFLGSEILHNRLSGLVIYLAAVTVNLILFLLSDILFAAPCVKDAIKIGIAEKDSSVAKIISDSCITVIYVCAYVTFFMCIGEVICTAVSFITPISPYVKILLSGTAEMTSGVCSLDELIISRRILIASAITGFGGLSAFMQTVSVCEKYGIPCNELICIKLISSFCVPPVTFVYLILSDLISKTGYSAAHKISPLFITIIFVSCAFIIAFIKKSTKKYKKSKVNF